MSLLRASLIGLLEQRSTYLHFPLSVWLVAEPLATRQPQAIAQGVSEAESLSVPQHAIPPAPRTSECENH